MGPAARGRQHAERPRRVTPPSQDCRVPVRQRRHLPSRTQWWRPHDGFVAEGRAAYAAALADRFCLDGGDRDGDWQALHQPGGGPADDHAWHAVGRRFHRFRRRVGTRRSASAHAGGGRRLPTASRASAARCSSTRCRKRDFTAKALLEGLPPGRTFSTASVPGSRITEHYRRSRRSDISAPRRTTGVRSRSSGRAIRRARAGASTKRAAACGPTRRCSTTGRTSSSIRVTTSMPIARFRAQQKLPNGEIWKNIVTEEKSKVAETLAEFRGNYKYNLLDRNVRAFNAQVPILAQWDDHEVTNDWSPDEELASGAYAREEHPHAGGARQPRLPRVHADARSARRKPAGSIAGFPTGRCSTCSCSTCAPTALRTPRGDRSLIFGAGSTRLAQARADEFAGNLEGDRRRSIDRPDQRGRGGAAATARRAGANAKSPIFWPSSSMPACATRSGSPPTCITPPRIYYDPNAARFQDFEPFWEFVSGPLHAGTWSPGKLDNTFGPRVMYQKGCSEGAGRKPRAVFRIAVLRPCGDRRRDRNHDGHAQGRRQPRPLVDPDRAAAGAMVGPAVLGRRLRISQ